MKIMENKRNRMRRYTGAPRRFLRKARDFYVESMFSFDGKVASASAGVIPCPATTHVSHIPNLPKNFGRHVPVESDGHNENLKELYRSISSKYHCSRMDINETRRQQQGTARYSVMDRSYSIALGKIGTIDEEEPCDFHEDVPTSNEILFARCRSHAVTRKNGFYY